MGCSEVFSNSNWMGEFNGDKRSDILFYYYKQSGPTSVWAKNFDWFLGSFNSNKELTCNGVIDNTAGFGNIWDGRPIWIGDFNGNGKDDVLFYFPGDDNWWLGKYDDTRAAGDKLYWTLAGNTIGFGHAIDKAVVFWIGKFSQSKKTEVLFYFPGDDNWWLGKYDDTRAAGDKLYWTHADNTIGFGHAINTAMTFWIGDFDGDGKDDVLFNFPGDDNWWLGKYDNTRAIGDKLYWTLAGNTLGFGHGAKYGSNTDRPTWIGKFSRTDRAQILFYFAGNDNWHLGTYDPTKPMGDRIVWTDAGNTAGFGHGAILDGRPIWTGDFSGDGKDDVLFYFPANDNWHLGRHNGNILDWSTKNPGNHVGNTVGFGHGAMSDGRPIWIGDFDGDGKDDVLFYFPGDGNWFLGSYDGSEIKWKRVSQRTRDTKNCEAGIMWTNYPQTQSLIPFSTCRPNNLASVIAIVRDAEAAHKRVHAFGSKWSFSDCAFTRDYVINTIDLSRPLGDTIKRALRPGQSLRLYHVEAGIRIRNLYENLDGLSLALETMGGSSGQSLAGAISTGTHGGDKFMPPLADSVLAIHLVTAGGTQYWVEPSQGITDPILLKTHVVPEIDPKNIVYDDATFNACLVSLGCMGVIYSVVLKVRQPYDLVETTVETTWQAFKANISSYLSDRKNRFLQVLVNPYSDTRNENHCLVTTRYEAGITEARKRPDVKAAVKKAGGEMFCKFSLDSLFRLDAKGIIDIKTEIEKWLIETATKGLINFDVPSTEESAKVIQGVLTHTPQERPKMVEHYWNILKARWPTGTFRGSSYSVMDLDYGKSIPSTESGHSIEMFFPIKPESNRIGFAEFVDRAIVNLGRAEYTFFAGYLALRFTGQTRAYLGMQQWNPTCSVEIAVAKGVQGLPELLGGLLNIGLEGGGFAHWGQHIDWAHESHGSIYPQYARWRQVYAKMSNNFAARTFENGLSLRWNLTTPNDAQFVSHTVPQVMEAGQSQSVTVTMQNSGTSSWTRSGAYRLGSQAPQDNLIWGIQRVELPNDVLPGGRVTFQFNIVGPDKGIGSGTTRFFRWRMLHELVEWFGMVTPSVGIRVVPTKGTTTVPDVLQISWNIAKKQILDAFLNPVSTGSNASGSWVESQSPTGGTVVPVGSTVKAHLRTGPIP